MITWPNWLTPEMAFEIAVGITTVLLFVMVLALTTIIVVKVCHAINVMWLLLLRGSRYNNYYCVQGQHGFGRQFFRPSHARIQIEQSY